MRRVALRIALVVACGSIAEGSSSHGRMVSWWYDFGENATVDKLNIATIKEHRNVFSRVSPYYGTVGLDGNVSSWWGRDAEIATWNKPLLDIGGIAVLPYLIDTSNSTQMHLVYENSTAVVADAVKIAQHYGFAGWFIDYEDETPPDTDPYKSQKLKAFLDQLGNALHQANKTLTICVASWSKLLSDQKTLASSAADELQNMDTSRDLRVMRQRSRPISLRSRPGILQGGYERPAWVLGSITMAMMGTKRTGTWRMARASYSM